MAEIKEQDWIECGNCLGTGKITTSIAAHQSAGEIVDEKEIEQICLACNGTGEILELPESEAAADE